MSAASPRRRRGNGSVQEKTIFEASEFLEERITKISSSWNNLKANYVHFSSSITLAYPLCRSAQSHEGSFSEVNSLKDVKDCYEAVKAKQFTESAFVINTFLHTLRELEQLYDEVDKCRPTLVANQDSKKARHVREFCVGLEAWRKMVEGGEVPQSVHHDVLSITQDTDILRRTGRIFSTIPVMLDHANTLVKTMKRGWPPRLDRNLQRPRTAGVLTSPRLGRSSSVTTMQQLSLDGKKAQMMWRPQDAVVPGQAARPLMKSGSMPGLPTIGSGAVGSSLRRASFSDIDDEAPLSRCCSPSFSSSSAYETGQNSLSHVTITQSNVTISSSSDNESSQWSPMDNYKRPVVREITEALQSKFDEELDKVTTRLEKKITNATENLRDDIQNDLQQRDKRIDKIKSDVDQLSKFVDEKFSGLDIELLKVDVILKDYVRPLDDELIHVISQNIGPQVYPKLARELGMRQPQIEWIQQRHRDDEHEVVIAILHKWKQIAGTRKATVEAIIRALVKIDQRPTANQILLALKEN
ncbi:uncharacterized protein [Ptychodera flava]|uniref:uncharacterized protein n=1 Tax=Ptychodera flava TaxID=63121 RepID=UPI00396A7BDC